MISKIGFFVVAVVACCLQVEVCRAAPSTYTLPASRMFTVRGFAGRKADCAKIGSHIVSGAIGSARRFTPARGAVAVLKKRIKASKGKTRNKLRRELAQLSSKIEHNDRACRSDWMQRNCMPTLLPQFLTLHNDPGSGQIDLGPATACGNAPLLYQIVRTPEVGSAQIDGNAALYSVGFVETTDTFSFRACFVDTTACTEAQEASVTVDRRCLPTLSAKSMSVRENTSEELDLGPSSFCSGGELNYEIVQAPSTGTLTTSGNVASYDVSFFNGSTTAAFRACLPESGACTEPQSISITIHEAEFSGRSDSLSGYKDSISRREATYLVKKVALGGCQAIIQKGVDEGLRAMVHELLSDAGGGCSFLLPVTGNPTNRDPNVFGYWNYHPSAAGLNFQHWRVDSIFRILFTNARYGSGLREYLTWILWHNNFATNIATNNIVDPKLHYNLLWENALGFVGDFFYELFGPRRNPATSIRRVSPGVDPATPYDPDNFVFQNGEINPNNPLHEYSGVRRIFGDKLYHQALSNDENSVQRRNENLGRELLELQIAGARDPISGQPNYNENDVVASTYAISGYTHSDPNTNQDIMRGSGNGTPDPSRYWLTYNPARSAAGTGQPLTIFENTPYQRSGLFSSSYLHDEQAVINFIPFLMNEWSAPSRYFAAKIFTHIVHTQPTEEIVQHLAGVLLTYHSASNSDTGAPELKNYSIQSILEELLTSQAMFSDLARGNGISSPFEIFTSLFRMGELPLKNWWTPAHVETALGEAQQSLMAPPTVFGWKNYGVVRQGMVLNGEEWLRVASLIGTYRGIFDIVNSTFRQEWEAFDPLVIFPQGTATTAAQAVDLLLTRFNLVGDDTDGRPLISDGERTIMIEYLNNVSGGWNAANWLVRRTKMAGLYALVAGHPANFRK